ncbi:MAG: zf-HC2 domain-containing protein [Gemmatimonadaceae bacterium]|nr:zf-HC2 domain-containing protein [Gemmatimonadaceae bacterium]
MTDCGNAEIRDLLPDLAADALSPVETLRVQAHVDACSECAAELALLRIARAIRPLVAPVDVARIVAQLPRVNARTVGTNDGSVISLDAHRVAATPSSRAATWRARGVWRMAAAIGVIIAGGWSIMLVRAGGVTMVGGGRADSMRFANAVERVDTPASPKVPGMVANGTDSIATAVSFGGLSNYSDEELQRVLDRLDKWDGATSTEGVTTTPILPASRGGAE